MLKERQQTILEAVIRRYVRDAEPVASRDLVREFRFRVSPATIRNDMLALDEEGYLEQPHTSAGRVPTDRGYRFFVDHTLVDAELPRRDQERISHAFTERDEDAFIRAFSRAVAEMSALFTASGLFDEPVFYNTGFADILDEPEFSDTAVTKRFAQLADILEDEIRSRYHPALAIHDVFIGEENPLKAAHDFSMMISTWAHPRGFRGFLALCGPKRMDYQKVTSLINFIDEHYGG